MNGDKAGSISEAVDRNPWPEVRTASGQRLPYQYAVKDQAGKVSYVLDVVAYSEIGFERLELPSEFLDIAARGVKVEFNVTIYEGLSIVTRIWIDRGDGTFI